MERRGRISRGIEKAKSVIFKNQERALKVAFSEYGGALISLIAATKSIDHNLHGLITVGLFALAGLFGFAGLATESKALHTPSRNPIKPTETSLPAYHAPHPPTS